MTEEAMPVVWTKPHCVQCNAVIRWMDQNSPTYMVKNLMDDLDQVAAFQDQGILQAPITVFPGCEPISGFNPGALKAAVEDS